jgi:hypothetical protein
MTQISRLFASSAVSAFNRIGDQGSRIRQASNRFTTDAHGLTRIDPAIPSTATGRFDRPVRQAQGRRTQGPERGRGSGRGSIRSTDRANEERSYDGRSIIEAVASIRVHRRPSVVKRIELFRLNRDYRVIRITCPGSAMIVSVSPASVSTASPRVTLAGAVPQGFLS